MTAAQRRFLLLGDWHWLVRDPLDVLRLAFFAGTIAFALMGRSTAVGLTAASLLLLIARIINLPRPFDLGVIVAMTFIAWGTALSLYGKYHFYDTIVHGTTPIFYAPVLYVCLVRLDVLSDPVTTSAARQHAGVFVSTLAVGMAVGAGYEVVEWLSDSLAGTHFVEDADDTGRDLLADTLGSLVGAAYVTAWSVRSWTSRRRTYRAAPAPRLPVGAAVPRLRRAVPALALAAAGAGSLAFGVLVAAWPQPTVRTLVLLFGIYAVGHGVLQLVVSAVERRADPGRSLAVHALGMVAAGIVVLAWPDISATALFYLIAFGMLLAGLAGVALASTLALQPRERTLLGAAALASVVLGVVVLAWPDHTVAALRWLVAVQALVLGPVLLAGALRMRRREEAPPPAPVET